ncbi:MAG: hypothetical protein RSD03_01565 [Lachnospiraceae bacterium]
METGFVILNQPALNSGSELDQPTSLLLMIALSFSCITNGIDAVPLVGAFLVYVVALSMVNVRSDASSTDCKTTMLPGE